MRVQLNSEQQQMLAQVGISIVPEKDYSEDEIFDIVDQVHDIEISYAQDADTNATAKRLAKAYAEIADFLQNQIPE